MRTRFEQLLEDNKATPAVDTVTAMIEIAGVLATDDGAEFGRLIYQTLSSLSQTLLGPVI